MAESWTHQDFEDMRKDWGNNTLVGWKAIYDDGNKKWEIRSTDMLFVDAPQEAIQVLIKYYKRAKGGYSREIVNGLDLVVLFSEQPLYLDLPPEIKKGKNLTNKRFENIIKDVRADEEIVIGMKDIAPQ